MQPSGTARARAALRCIIAGILLDARNPEGLSDAEEDATVTAAQEHGAGRAVSGFSVEEMVAEFRALRASVIRLWTRTHGEADVNTLGDMTRFNEAVDQAIAESIAQYTSEIGRSKDRFLAILGHDLRTPLGAIITSAQFILDEDDHDLPHRALINGIATSARRMNQMVTDLLDFTHMRFGDAMHIDRRTTARSTSVPRRRKSLRDGSHVRFAAGMLDRYRVNTAGALFCTQRRAYVLMCLLARNAERPVRVRGEAQIT
ncbi:MAG TPA: histidine kinase dimerization/phospho-acceptor domain-containing protein [Longimicrobiales bacterium]|nr:histidine kinase dimerization/phospho-acceptor domain-containing protein [Longimicrobiales bacterium]